MRSNLLYAKASGFARLCFAVAKEAIKRSISLMLGPWLWGSSGLRTSK